MTCHVSWFQPFSLKNIYKKLQSILFLYLLTKFQSDSQRESYDNFPQVTCLECNLGVHKKTKFIRSYLRKYSAKSYEIWTQGSIQFLLKWVFFLASKTSQEKSYSKNSMMTCLEQRNPRIQSSDTKCYETAQEKIEKIDQCLIIQPLRGGNLLYIT